MKIKKPNLVAEIGCNHKGSLKIALNMISKLGNFCNVKHVKFQKRDNKLLLGESFSKPHPNPENSYGTSYGKHREFLEFSSEQHRKIIRYCKKLNMKYSCSAWDINSAKILNKLNTKNIKIPSACNLDFDLLDYLLKFYNGKIHISLGMTKRSEEKKIFQKVKKAGKLNKLVLYACTSAYPADVSDMALLEVDRLFKSYSRYGVEIGFSGHYSGISIDNLTLLMGASWIERHFTLDRTWKGTDHAASLEPDGMRRLNINLNDSYKALHRKKKEILSVEKFQRKKLKLIK